MKNKILAIAMAAMMSVVSTCTVFAEDLVVRTFDNISSSDTEDIVIESVEATPDNACLYDFTAKMKIVSSKGFASSLGANLKNSIDTSEYNYINAWIYSPQEQPPADEKYTNARIELDVYDSSDNRARTFIPVDWAGWKCVSVPVSDLSGSTYEKNTFTRVRIAANYGDRSWGNDTYLCVDKIWFSTENPYGQTDNSGDIDTLTNVTYNNFVVSETQTMINQQSLRFNTINDDHYINFNSPVDASDYNYINFWLYSPEDQSYTQDSANVTPNIKAAVRTKIDIYNASADNIPINYSGWKMFSIPLSEFVDFQNSADKKITNLRLRINSSGCVPFAENIYLYLGKMWLSKEKSACACEAKELKFDSADGLISSIDNKVTIKFCGPVNVNDLQKIKLKKTVDSSEIAVTPSVLSDDSIGIEFNSLLENGTEYQLTVDENAVMDSNGLGNTQKIFSFTTESKGVWATAPTLYNGTVKILTVPESSFMRTGAYVYNASDNDKNVMLVIANYGSTNNELLKIKIKNETVTANSRKTILSEMVSSNANDNIKLFIWDNEYCPLEK